MKDYAAIQFWAHMLDEVFCKNELLTEGKHWPKDYIKTAYNIIKSSSLGKQSWYIDEYIKKDLDTFVNEFAPLSHKNSNLGFFSTIVRWFIEYSGTSQQKYQEFIERKLDRIIGTLQVILNDPSYDKIKDEIKQKWTFAQFEELQKKIADEAKASSDDKMKNIVKRDDYDVIPIYSYEELNKKFGGDWTGYKGQSEWCHTNGKSTYESWTKNGTQMFFVLAKKDWQSIKAPTQKPNQTDNAYDEYGLSLIAILVDVYTGDLLNETLRWNHIIEPSNVNPGATVDNAFKNNWGELCQVVGMDVKSICRDECKKMKDKIDDIAKNANNRCKDILKNAKIITDVTIPEEIRKFITKVDIPDNIESIRMYSFQKCSNLTSVTIPNSVTSIGENAFFYCSGLASVTIPDSVTSIGENAFLGCSGLTSVTIGNGVTSIGKCAFLNCSSLTSLTIPDSVTSIGDWAFGGCRSLTSVTIPNSVTSIGDGAFDHCRKLTSMTIPNNVTSIGVGAFYWCRGLISVTIGNGVTSIGDSAFYACSKLMNITIPDSVTHIGESAFHNCRGLTSVTISNGVTSIGESAFYNCNGLTSLTIPDSVISIGNGAFHNCNGLTSVTIPNSVTSIGESAFHNCSRLISIMIPNSVMSIGTGAFYWCSNLKSLMFKGKSFDQVKSMEHYPWGIKDESIIKCKNKINESKIKNNNAIQFWTHMIDEACGKDSENDEFTESTYNDSTSDYLRTYVPDEWHGIKKLVTVGDFLDAIANIYSGQQNAYVCFAPERDSGAKIFGQVNSIFEESESNGKHCIMTLAPYKNGSRIQDCSIDGITSRPLHLSEIAKMMSNMDENNVLFVRYTDPQAYGPKAGQIIEQMIDEITFDQRYGVFLRPREDLAPKVVEKGSDSLFN